MKSMVQFFLMIMRFNSIDSIFLTYLGLAPVRSSRQDQIHSSIVSTLLALMDGLDNRGQVVVIGRLFNKQFLLF